MPVFNPVTVVHFSFEGMNAKWTVCISVQVLCLMDDFFYEMPFMWVLTVVLNPLSV